MYFWLTHFAIMVNRLKYLQLFLVQHQASRSISEELCTLQNSPSRVLCFEYFFKHAHQMCIILKQLALWHFGNGYWWFLRLPDVYINNIDPPRGETYPVNPPLPHRLEESCPWCQYVGSSTPEGLQGAGHWGCGPEEQWVGHCLQVERSGWGH